MILYLDLILFLNFFFDFFLLLTVSVLLKRNVSIYRLMFASFIGGFSILFLFTSISNQMLFLFKIIFSIFLIIFTFSFKNITYTLHNILYFYFASFCLGGGIYSLSLNKHVHLGLGFQTSSLSLNIIGLLFLSPIFLYLYIKQFTRWKRNYQKYYKIDIKIGKKKMKTSGFLDTGNRLCDPVSKKPVVLMCKERFKKLEKNQKFIFVPYKTISESGILKCIFIDQLIIEGKGVYHHILLGKMNDNIMMDGVDVILNEKILEG